MKNSKIILIVMAIVLVCYFVFGIISIILPILFGSIFLIGDLIFSVVKDLIKKECHDRKENKK